MLMDKSLSILGKKESDSFFTYDFIGTDKMLTYSKASRKLYLIIKSGMNKGKIISTIETGIEFTYDLFIDQARNTFTEIINRSEYSMDHKASLS